MTHFSAGHLLLAHFVGRPRTHCMSCSPAHSASTVVLGFLRSCRSRSQSLRTSASVAGQGHHTVGEYAFLLKSCSSLRRCTARPPDRSDWSVCRVCSPARPPALRMVHISNFTSQFQHTRTHRARFSRRVPSDHRMAVRRRGPVKVSVLYYEEIHLPCGSHAPGTGCAYVPGRHGAKPHASIAPPL